VYKTVQQVFSRSLGQHFVFFMHFTFNEMVILHWYLNMDFVFLVVTLHVIVKN